VKTVASAANSLFDTLMLLVPGASKRTLRQMLSQGRVSVNGEFCNVTSRKIMPGDILEIGPRRAPAKLPGGLTILFEDNDILIIVKPSGLLTVATEDERERTAYFYLRQHLQSRDQRQRLFIVHRLDKFASGVLVFAKSQRVKQVLQGIFMQHAIQRKYWAIVEGKVGKQQGTIRSYLAENKSLRMHSTENRRGGKLAVTHYRVLRHLGKFTALEVTLETGRKNQIRVHLSEMGHPLVGDRAYDSTQDPLGRLGLHAFLLGFNHPVTGEPLVFKTDPPPEFRRYLPIAD
jgi:23S rRNA pseudouridine1911/1915/1917 synthase